MNNANKYVRTIQAQRGRTSWHELGFKVSYESEGTVWPMVELLDEAGVDGLAHLEPRADMRKRRRDS